MRVRRHPGLVEAEIVGVRAPSHRHQQMRAHDLGRPLGAIDADGDPLVVAGETDAGGVEAKLDALLGQDLGDGGGDILVLARDQPRHHLDDGDFAPEAAKHLAELQADIAAADDDQMLRQEIHIHHRAVGEKGHLVQPRDRRPRGPSADIDEDLLRAQHLGADLDLPRRDEAAMALIDRAVGLAPQTALDAGGRERDDAVLARLDLGHVDLDRAGDLDAELGPAARQMRRIGAGHHGLGGRAAGIDAGPAEELALDDRDLLPRLRQPPRQRRPRLAGADDDGVIIRHRSSPPDL